MNPADAKAIELAERMGWAWSSYGRGSINNGCIDMIDPSDKSGCGEAHSLPEFAAFAESEMAKRGWRNDSREGNAYFTTSEPPYIDVETTHHYPFDPTDPYSKAEATISACLEALKASE